MSGVANGQIPAVQAEVLSEALHAYFPPGNPYHVPPEQRDVFVAHEIEGLSFADMAAQWRVPEYGAARL